MKTLVALIIVTFLGVAFGRTVPPEDEYTLQAIEELRHMSSQRLLSDISEPKCSTDKKENSIECCINMKWMKQNRTICIELSMNITTLQVDFALSFDGEEVFNHVLTVGEICAPLPGLLKQLNVCAQAYYVDVDTKPPRLSFDACFVIKLGGFFHFNLNCIKLDKEGKFSQNNDIKPESKGILMLNLEEGNLKFDVNNPIPKDIMDKIEKGWNIFGKDANELMDKVGAGVSDAAKDAQKELEKLADKAKDTIANEVNKVTGALGAFGDKVSGWFG